MFFGLFGWMGIIRRRKEIFFNEVVQLFQAVTGHGKTEKKDLQETIKTALVSKQDMDENEDLRGPSVQGKEQQNLQCLNSVTGMSAEQVASSVAYEDITIIVF